MHKHTHTYTHRGELYPVETDLRLCDVLSTGSEVTVDMEANVLTDHSNSKTYELKAIGDVSVPTSCFLCVQMSAFSRLQVSECANCVFFYVSRCLPSPDSRCLSVPTAFFLCVSRCLSLCLHPICASFDQFLPAHHM